METLRVYDDPALPDCEIEKLVDRIAITNTPMVDGILADGCTE